MSDKRAAFEKWITDTYHSDVEWQEERNCYAEFPVHIAWQAWRAALRGQPSREEVNPIIERALTQFAMCISVLAGDDRTRHEVIVEESRPIMRDAFNLINAIKNRTPQVAAPEQQPAKSLGVGPAVSVPSLDDKPQQSEAEQSQSATGLMLPCPHCGEADVDATFAKSSDGELAAGCYVCGMTGPTSHTARDAADRWNALPRRSMNAHNDKEKS